MEPFDGDGEIRELFCVEFGSKVGGSSRGVSKDYERPDFDTSKAIGFRTMSRSLIIHSRQFYNQNSSDKHYVSRVEIHHCLARQLH